MPLDLLDSPKGCGDGFLRVWDLKNGSIHKYFDAHAPNGVLCLDVKGHLLASGSTGESVKVWDTSKDYECTMSVTGDFQAAWCVKLIPSSLLVGCEDFSVLSFSLSTSELLFRLIGHSAPVRALLSLNGNIYSGSDDGTIRVWSMKRDGDDRGDRGNGRKREGLMCVGILKGHNGGVRGLERVGSCVMSASVDGTMRCWDLETGEIILHSL